MSANNVPDFPFISLHNEIVKYFQDRDKSVASQRKEWLDSLKQSDSSELWAGQEGKMLSTQIFSQVYFNKIFYLHLFRKMPKQDSKQLGTVLATC